MTSYSFSLEQATLPDDLISSANQPSYHDQAPLSSHSIWPLTVVILSLLSRTRLTLRSSTLSSAPISFMLMIITCPCFRHPAFYPRPRESQLTAPNHTGASKPAPKPSTNKHPLVENIPLKVDFSQTLSSSL